MHSDVSAYFVFVSSTGHLGLIDIFGHHGNVLATMHGNRYLILSLPTLLQQFILKSNAKEGKEKQASGHMLHIFFGCYGNILVSIVTDILGYLFPSSYNHLSGTSMPNWPLSDPDKVFWSPWQRLLW